MAKSGLLMDIRPLRESADFRRLWLGTGLSLIGSQMTTFAVALQVFNITRSALAVGAVGLASAIPAVLFGLVGGAIADAIDRRKIVLVTTAGQAGVAMLFAVQAFAEFNQVWILYLLVAGNSLLNAVNGPARRIFLPRLLPPERIPAGAALNMFAFHFSNTAGPMLAGVFAALWGLKVLYLIDAITFAAALYGIFRLPSMRPESGATRPTVRSVLDGIGFIRRSKVLTGAFLADMNAMVLGMPIALFPAINADRFGGSAETLGLLMAAPAVGGVLGTALSGPITRASRHGLGMLVSGAVWGAGLVAFGLSGDLLLASAFLVIAGVADVVSVVFCTSIVQVVTPDGYRGRVSSAEYIVGVGGPQLGNFRAGAVGSLTSPTFSVVSGGVSCILASLAIRLAIPAFAHYRHQTNEQPARSEEEREDATERRSD